MYIPNEKYLSYYVSGDKKSYSKLDYNTTPHDLVGYHFYDDSFNNIEEPQESLDELYRTRALELREKYDALAIEVHNIEGFNTLWSFLSNDIKVDEVFFYYSKMDDISLYNKILKYNIYPHIKKLQNHFNFYFRGLECAEHFMEKMWDTQTKERLSWLENGPWTGNSIIHKNLFDIEPEYRKAKNLGIIYSRGKPFVFPKENTFKFCDILYPIDFIQELCEYSSEDFYWYPGSKIALKQAYMVRDWSKKNPNYLNMVATLEKPTEDYVPTRLTNRIIYSEVKENMFKYDLISTKSIYDIRARCSYTQNYGSPQAWLSYYKQPISDHITKNMDFIRQNIDKSWLINGDIYNGTKKVWSKPHKMI